MAFQRTPPEELFKCWIKDTERKIDILIEKGYSKDQAIELLKIWALQGLAQSNY